MVEPMGLRVLIVLLLVLISPLSVWPSAAKVRVALAGEPTGVRLIMMEEAGCTWCERWLAEIGEIYHLTPEGRRAPLRRIDVHEPIPVDLAHLRLAYFTPTFVLVNDGQEIGRIKGYPGEDLFWMLLGELLNKLEPSGPIEAEAGR
jgi:thioredoxin-related protein